MAKKSKRFKKKTKRIILFSSIFVAALIIIAAITFLVLNSKSESFVNTLNGTLDITPSSQSPTYYSCEQICSQNGFSKSYNFFTSCKAGETKITYGYPGQLPLFICCCYNEATLPIHTCTDTDGGDNKDVPGTVTYDNNINNRYMDSCFDATTVYEYRCNADNSWQGGKESCDSGETCISSRSGGYCKAHVWNPGDTVWEGSGAASIIGNSPQTSSIDLSQYGIGVDGNCRLGIQLSTAWQYANDKCVGIPGMQGVKWDFYDSNGLEYTRTDTTPVSLGVDLHPETHILNWDGHTKWIASMMPFPFQYPDCSITYEYTARIYIYDCL